MQVMVILHTQALFSGSGHTMYGPSPKVKRKKHFCNYVMQAAAFLPRKLQVW